METIDVERRDGIVTVTLNRPDKKNAVNERMWSELLEAFLEVRDRADDRVLVVTGAGDEFCSGADLTDAGAAAHPLLRMRHIGDVALALHRLPKPTIAKVDGVAVGAGCNLALGCDFVVASNRARFSEIFAQRGLSIDFGGSWILPRLVGLQKAKELAFFADIIDAERAVSLGIATKVVSPDLLDATVAEWAARLAAGPAVALSLTKAMLNESFALSFEQAVEAEARCQAVNIPGPEAAEALAAFVEKRAPQFRNATDGR